MFICKGTVRRAIPQSKGLCTHTILVKIFGSYCHIYVHGTPKCKHIGTLRIIDLHTYPTSQDYKISFPKLLTTYGTNKCGVRARSSQFRLENLCF